MRWALLIALAGLVSAVFTGLRRYYAFREARWSEAVLRDRMFAHLQRLHFSFHDEAQTGQLMSRANTDLQQVQNFIVLIPLTMSNAVTVTAVTVILFRTNWLLALMALGMLPFVNYFAKRFSTQLHPTMVGIQQESAELAAVVEETVSGVRVVKGFGAEDIQAAGSAPRPTTSTRSRSRRPGSAPATGRRSSCCRTSAWSRCSATAVTSCSTASSSSATSSPSTPTSCCSSGRCGCSG